MRLLPLILLLSACGGPPPPSFTEQLEATATADAPTRGWWRYLAGDREGAEEAFAQTPAQPLAALGRARLALNQRDQRGALEAALQAAKGEGIVRLLGAAWAREAARSLRGGDTLVEALAPRRKALTAPKWTVRVSFLPFVHLRRLYQRAPRIEDGKLRALGKWWALSDKAPRPDADGLVLTVWPLPEGPAHLELEVEGPAAAWRGGKLVLATPLDRYPADTLRFTAPGEGPLIVVWAANRKPAAWQLEAPAPPAPRGHGPAVAERAPGPDWLARALSLELALLDGDAPVARRLLEGAPDSPAFALIRARLAPLDGGRSTRAARDEARASWAAAEVLAQPLARYGLGRLDRRSGKYAEARAHLEALTAQVPEDHEAWAELTRSYTALGWTEEGRRALASARQTVPDRCDLLDLESALVNVGSSARLRMIESYRACKRPLDAVSRLLEMKRPKAALKALDALDAKEAKKSKARGMRARALIGLGRLEEARALRAKSTSVEALIAVADLDRATGRAELDEALRKVVSKAPTRAEALDLIATQPQWSPFAGLTFVTEQLITAFEAEGWLPKEDVRLLDHSALLYFKDGKSLRWVHEVLAVRSRDAADRFGEISLPTDSRLLWLYTRKADGRRLDAEEQPEKESITLLDLDPGDYIVAVYLEPGDNGYLYDSGFLTPRVYFQGVDLPTWRHRFEVYAPDATAPDYQRHAEAPEPDAVRLEGRAGLRFEAEAIDVLPAENDAPPAGLWLPSVRAGRKVKLEDDLDYIRDRALGLMRRSDAFDGWARSKSQISTGPRRNEVSTSRPAQAKAAPDSEGGEDPIRSLARAVREAVDGEYGLVDQAVVSALESGAGNRALVLSAALQANNIPHRLLLARPKVHVSAGPFLTAADFDRPLIDLGDQLIDPGPSRAAPGFIPFGFVGGDALVVWPPTAGHGPVALGPRSVRDHRVVRVEAHWKEDGALEGSVVDTLVGQEAIVIGRYLSRLDPEQRPRLVERLLVGAFPTGHVTAFEDPADHDPDGPLVLRYQFSAEPADALRLGLFPVAPASGYAILPERKLPLNITLPTDLSVHISLESDLPFAVEGARPGTHVHGDSRYALSLDVDSDSMEAKATMKIAGGLLSPGGYPDFAAWARKVEAAEVMSLRR